MQFQSNCAKSRVPRAVVAPIVVTTCEALQAAFARSVELGSMMLEKFQTDYLLAKQFNIDKSQCQKLIKIIRKRKRHIIVISSLIGVIAFVIWMAIFISITSVLEGTSWDILEILGNLGAIGFVLGMFSGLGLALILSQVSEVAIRRHLLRRQFQYHLLTPACFWCGYVLKGLECKDHYVKCPECGERSRICR